MCSRQCNRVALSSFSIAAWIWSAVLLAVAFHRCVGLVTGDALDRRKVNTGLDEEGDGGVAQRVTHHLTFADNERLLFRGKMQS